MGKERLDKILGHMGVGSRKDLKEIVKRGRVTVEGQVVRDPGLQVDPQAQAIAVDGRVMAFQRHFYVLLHKPGGVITATEDPGARTVMDVLPPDLFHRELFPVGRLDKDTEGLLLLTTDGELGHRLLSPKWHVDKRYLVRVDRPLEPADVPAFEGRIILEDGYECLPAHLEILAPQEAVCTIREGKYHQVKRMFEARGKSVVYLKRLSMGPLALGDLPLGQARPLAEPEIEVLYASAGLARL
jgi:16S rRNA pseudouridine516 synthase